MKKMYLIKQNRNEHSDIDPCCSAIDNTSPFTSQKTITPRLPADYGKIDRSLREGISFNEIYTSFHDRAATCSNRPYAFPQDGSTTTGNLTGFTGGACNER
ncbi:MAG: hypothetical protein KAS23_02250 [Anaerohalosphaera sp.]|nr:hypothetical protein [Anaerohalosphaera sp.]